MQLLKDDFVEEDDIRERVEYLENMEESLLSLRIENSSDEEEEEEEEGKDNDY